MKEINISDQVLGERIKELEKIVIANALRWLDENEPKWDLDEPIDRQAFINDLLEHMGKESESDV